MCVRTHIREIFVLKSLFHSILLFSSMLFEIFLSSFFSAFSFFPMFNNISCVTDLQINS